MEMRDEKFFFIFYFFIFIFLFLIYLLRTLFFVEGAASWMSGKVWDGTGKSDGHRWPAATPLHEASRIF